MPEKAALTVDEIATALPKRRGGKLVMLLGLSLGAAVFAGGGFGAAWFVFHERNSPMSQALRMIERPVESDTARPPGGMPEPTRPTPADGTFQTTYFSFAEPLTTNPQGSRRFIQVGVTLSTQYDAKVMDFVSRHEPALRSDMLAVIGGFSEEAMSGREGREALALALREAINERLVALEGFGGVEGVFFPSFVLQ